MKIDTSKPSNQFWAILISTLAIGIIFVALNAWMFQSCEAGLGCLGLMYISPFILLFSIIISYFVIYPKMYRFLEMKYPSKIDKNKKMNKKPIKPISLFLGIVLGIATFMIIGFMIGKETTTLMNQSDKYIPLLIVGEMFLLIFLPVIWSKAIDKLINK